VSVLSGEMIEFRPIGFVHNGVADPAGVRWEELVSQIEVDKAYLPALEGIEEFSHVVVVFYFHRQPGGSPPLQVHPEQRADMPLVGVFATRSPRRPNPIGLTAVELLGREGNVLTVRGLDALDGTPVLDLKPYLPRGDQISGVRVPSWLRCLWAIHDEERGHG
jgi:tRNA-Thr(GGU) m(6)t(6)A37 methyltransferase TsaA